MLYFPTYALCLLRLQETDERYNRLMQLAGQAITEGLRPEEMGRLFSQLDTEFPDRCFRPVVREYSTTEGLFRKTTTRRALWELPQLNHLCCGLGFSEEGNGIKAHLVMGMELLIANPAQGAWMLLLVDGNKFYRSSNAAGDRYFLGTDQQGFMKPHDAMSYFDKQGKLAVGGGASQPVRARDTNVPAFAQRTLRLG